MHKKENFYGVGGVGIDLRGVILAYSTDSGITWKHKELPFQLLDPTECLLNSKTCSDSFNALGYFQGYEGLIGNVAPSSFSITDNGEILIAYPSFFSSPFKFKFIGGKLE